jgi:predicted enzyme related to lactoylglutathione lyase
MTSITHITLESPDPKSAKAFYDAAFGSGDLIATAKSDAPTDGFRGFTLSLVVEQLATLQSLFDAAVAAGGTVIKPIATSLWGTGASIQGPDGAVWTLATSAKKNKGPVIDEVPQLVLLLAQDDVAASKQFYVDKGLTVSKSFGKYIEFEKSGAISLALYSRKALAKNAGVDPEGSGSHRIVIGGGSFTDPSGFVWA